MATPFSFRLIAATAALTALAACHRPADSAWYNRGGPESLLDVSNEVVNLSVAGPQELLQVSNWVQQDKPTRAELYCIAGDSHCKDARKLLDLQGVPVNEIPSSNQMVALVYERVLARDCNQRFVDNHANNYNAPHPAFGCAISANIVQHVSDKQQFVNPNLGDLPAARGGVAAYERAYAAPSKGEAKGGVTNSIVGSSSSGSSN